MTDPTTDPNDNLMNQLAAADPVDRSQLPSAEDAPAQQVLASAMSEQAVAGTSIDENPYALPAEGASVVQLDQGPDQSRSRRNPLMLLSAAAAVLIVVGGLLVFSPDNTQTAVATVHSAAAATAEADSARIAVTFELDGTDGTETGSVSGQVDAAYAGEDISFTLGLEELSGEAAGAFPAPNEVRLIDGIAYVDAGGQWFAVDTEGFLGDVVSDFVDPRSVLETVQELPEVTEIETVTVDGVETTHYRSVVDLADGESLAASGWLPFEAVGEIDADGEVTVDVFVDGEGVLRMLDLSGDVQDPDGSGESGTFEVSTKFFDFGADIVVEAPEGVQVFDPLESFGEGE